MLDLARDIDGAVIVFGMHAASFVNASIPVP
jgi:hypothetical protein